MVRIRRAEAKPVDLEAVLNTAQEAAECTRVTFLHRIEARPPANSLVVHASDPNTAQVIVSTIEPGTLFLDIGVGMHGEWFIRNDAQLSDALAVLEQLFEGVFRGQVIEDVRGRPGGRLSIHGKVTTPSKTHKFTHHAVGISSEGRGSHHYAPYPSLSG